MRKFLRHLQYWLQLRQLDSDLSEEIEAHRAMKQAELERSGVAPAEAARRSRRALGNVTLACEEARDIWTLPRLESVWRDLRVGARAFRRFPGFTAISVLTLTLGIGANTAIFSAVQAVLLRPLPYAQPNQLAMLWSDDTKRGLHEAPTSALLANDWRSQSRAFADMAIFSTNTAILTGSDAPERTVTAFVSANLFPLLRVPAAVGRTFSSDEEQRAERVAVVSHDVWQRRLGGTPDAIGKTLRIDAQVLIFTTVLSLAAALVFGLVPAWTMSRTDPNESLKEGGSGFAGGRLRRSRGTLVVVECALAVLLLTGAGLMIRSFLKLQAIVPGFNPERVLLVMTSVTPGLRPAVTPPRDSGAAMFATREDLFFRVSERVSAIGGVRSVGLIGSFLLSGPADESITVEGRSVDDAGRTAGELATADVDTGFFQTMGVPLVRGRFFNRADALDKIRLFFNSAKGVFPTPARAPASEAAIVNQTFVRRFFPVEDPIGKRFYIGNPGKYYWWRACGCRS